MAEIIASGITIGTLTAQITSSAIKLRSYWDQFQDAPQDIQDLVEEHDILQDLLSEMEDQQQRSTLPDIVWNQTTSNRCLELCRRNAAELKMITDQLGPNSKCNSRFKKGRAAAKTMLRKEKIDRCKAKIESTSRLLSLSRNNYIE